jgi:hypothetical protein
VSCCALLFLATSVAAAQTTPDDYRPVPGQPGKDVVWIPTPQDTVEKMLDMARVTPQDYVIDLGSGDGRNVSAAAAAGVSDKAAFLWGDMFEADISQATVLMLFLLPDHLARLAPKFLSLKPGARIVSNTYTIGGGWEPDDSTRGEPCTSWCIAMLYVVPAQVAGSWRLADGSTLTLEQTFQKISGTLDIDGIALPLEDGRLTGEEIRFTVNQVGYTGSVTGDTMKGSAKGRAAREWSAARQ